MSGKIGVPAEGLAETIRKWLTEHSSPRGKTDGIQQRHSSAYPQNKPKVDDREAEGSCPSTNPSSLAQLLGLISASVLEPPGGGRCCVPRRKGFQKKICKCPIIHEKLLLSLVIRKMKIKTMTRYHFIPTKKMTITQKTDITKC